MTGGTRALGARERLDALVRHPLILWSAFALVHLALGLICLTAPSRPMGDVTLTYSVWARQGLEAGVWVGIDTPWVYPVLAIVPMVASAAFGWAFYASTWLTIVMLVDAAVFAVLLRRGGAARATAASAWWWLGFLLALGPVAMGRIDSITAAVALAGMLVIVGRPRLGGVLLAIGAWVKVWPAALVGAALIALRSRVTIATAAIATTVVVLLAGLVAGGGSRLFSFIVQQSDRGLQIESPLAGVAMWTAWAGGGTHLYYDRSILTYQLQGPGTEFAAALSTPLLALAVAGIVALGVVGAVRRRPPAILLPPLALALTCALILFNKVGSPQFAGWLAVPIVFGLVTARVDGGASFRVPALAGLAIAALTHVVYPYLYGALLQLDAGVLTALTVRNALYLVLTAWALIALARAVRRDVRASRG